MSTKCELCKGMGVTCIQKGPFSIKSVAGPNSSEATVKLNGGSSDERILYVTAPISQCEYRRGSVSQDQIVEGINRLLNQFPNRTVIVPSRLG